MFIDKTEGNKQMTKIDFTLNVTTEYCSKFIIENDYYFYRFYVEDGVLFFDFSPVRKKNFTIIAFKNGSRGAVIHAFLEENSNLIDDKGRYVFEKIENDTYVLTKTDSNTCYVSACEKKDVFVYNGAERIFTISPNLLADINIFKNVDMIVFETDNRGNRYIRKATKREIENSNKNSFGSKIKNRVYSYKTNIFDGEQVFKLESLTKTKYILREIETVTKNAPCITVSLNR